VNHLPATTRRETASSENWKRSCYE